MSPNFADLNLGSRQAEPSFAARHGRSLKPAETNDRTASFSSSASDLATFFFRGILEVVMAVILRIDPFSVFFLLFFTKS